MLDAHGETSDQIDVVIHDRHFCPLLFEQDGERYIPAESVYAVFEVRPELSRQVVAYAAEKARSVRRLHRTSGSLVDRGVPRPPREPFEIIAGVLAVGSSWSPAFGERLGEALVTEDAESRLQLGCAPRDGAFEAFFGDGKPLLHASDAEGALVFFLMRLFQRLQAIGSPMAIDLREYSRPLAESNSTAEFREVL